MRTVITFIEISLLSILPIFSQEANNTLNCKTYQIMETDSMPVFRGGYDALLSYIDTNLVFPPIYNDASIQGKVICKFRVRADGSISDVRVIQGLDKELDDEVIRVIKSMPKWLPGKRRGKAVEVEYFLPIICLIQ